MDTSYFNRITATYGLGVDEFLDLFARQDHACAVCRANLVLFSSVKGEKPVVDHCHTTGRVRGILCNGCNVALGWLEKNPERTRKLSNYLRREGPREEVLRVRESAQRVVEASRAAAHERSTNYRGDNNDPTWVLISELERALRPSAGGETIVPKGENDAPKRRADVELMLVPDPEVRQAK